MRLADSNPSSDSQTPAPGIRCPNCGDGAEKCMYCHDLAVPDWEAICDCGLLSHGFHLIACEISKTPEPHAGGAKRMEGKVIES